MWSKTVFSVLVILPFRVFCLPDSHRTERISSSRPRNLVSETRVSDSYDFIIVGGGLAGLVIASRLTEDLNVTVLVLEAGESGDAVPNSINPPSGTYFDSLLGTSYDWQHKTIPQLHAQNRSLQWPRGKLLGGSSAINGMYYVRPSTTEVDAWKSLIEAEDNTATWGWDNFITAMKKGETFTPPSPDMQSLNDIKFEAASFGSNGPIHVSYPGFTFPVIGDWIPSLQNLGIMPVLNPNGGENYGAFISTVSVNPTNWTRSYSKSGYIDSLPPRNNLDILVSATVTRIIFSDVSSSADQVATGVEFASSAGVAKTVVKVNKEVILAAGALGSPHILLLSGVGPRDVLSTANVSVVSELPGVGQHLQDHLAAPVIWKSKVQTAGDLHATNSRLSTEPVVMSFINSATAYINASTLFDAPAEFQKSVADALPVLVDTLKSSQYQEVVEGYRAIYNATQAFLSQGLGQIELLLSINAPGAIAIQAALQHPYSQGRVYINSQSVFDPLVIDPSYFSHFADVALLRQGVKLARRLGQTAPLNNSLGDEIYPGPGVATDEQLDEWLARVASTEFHPTATCAMLPRAQGGVVNAKLQVYGLANVRVADSSVFPLAFSAHLGAGTYGLAETAADIIKASYALTNSTVNNPTSTSSPPSPSPPPPPSDTQSTQPASPTSKMNKAIPLAVVSFPSLAIWAVITITASLVL